MITCSITTSLLGCLVSSYLFFRYTWALDMGVLARIAAFAAYSALMAKPGFIIFF